MKALDNHITSNCGCFHSSCTKLGLQPIKIYKLRQTWKMAAILRLGRKQPKLFVLWVSKAFIRGRTNWLCARIQYWTSHGALPLTPNAAMEPNTWRGGETVPIPQLGRRIIQSLPWNLIKENHFWRLVRIPHHRITLPPAGIEDSLRTGYLCYSSERMDIITNINVSKKIE